MTRVKSEYEVEDSFIDRLEEIGYSFVEINNYSELLNNFRTQICKLNREKLLEEKGSAELSDSEFDRILLRLENHTIYESAKILREEWILNLDKYTYRQLSSPTFQREPSSNSRSTRR